MLLIILKISVLFKIYLTVLNNLSYLICNGSVQNLLSLKSVSIENQINHTFPMIFSFGTKPTPLMTRLSEELSRLSPMKKNLFLGAHASYIDGWDLENSRKLIAELNDTITRPDFVYSHAWKKDDLVVWDNRTVLHRGRPWDRDQKRIMHRTTVVGELTV